MIDEAKEQERLHCELVREIDGTKIYPRGALCKEKGFPCREWQEIAIEDRDGDHEICQFCGIQRIRIVHILEHPNYHRPIRVGCVCVERLTGEAKKSIKRREDATKRATEKKKAEAKREEQARERLILFLMMKFVKLDDGSYEFLNMRVAQFGWAWRYFIDGKRSSATYGQASAAQRAAILKRAEGPQP